jgi:hypothetical protein
MNICAGTRRANGELSTRKAQASLVAHGLSEGMLVANAVSINIASRSLLT